MNTADPFSVAGQNVLVVGGTRGIGRAIALDLARAGANVVANYVRTEAPASAIEALASSEGIRLRTLRADASTDKGRELIVGAVGELATPLHVIVFAAATGVHRELDKTSGRHFDFVFGLNVRAFLLLVEELLPAMSAGGSITALSSEGAARVMPHYGLVSASKAALEALCRQWAVELAPRGIRANVLSPGAIPTDAWQILPGAEQRLKAATAATPRGMLVSLEEVAHTARFLASPAATGISGQVIVVDAAARIRGSG
jgi:enoyl-[acyl-carrier protein] reductase III